MHWVLQSNLLHEGHADLVAALRRAGAQFSEHKVVPFAGDIIPDVSPPNPVVVFGTHSMCLLAKRKGWTPGCFDVLNVPFAEQRAKWGDNMLNADATVCRFGDAAPTIDEFFIRPTADSKYFAGTVMSRAELSDWQHKVAVLGEDDGSGLRANTEVMWAVPKYIDAEYRTWVIDGRIVTATRYPKPGAADPAALDFAGRMVEVYAPLRAFVLDVCLSVGAWKIVEINTINAAGFYAADLDALVGAIQAMPLAN